MLHPYDTARFMKKLAPRSSLQFKVGPQFTPTSSVKNIFNSKGVLMEPLLTPRIDRGFEIINNEWVGYKRNYFTLVSTFCFQGVGFEEFAGDRYYYDDPVVKAPQTIQYFGIRLVAKCVDDDKDVSLIQHTAKRDLGPQFVPPVHPVVPSELPDHTTIREAANVRNTGKIARLNEVFFFDRNEHDVRHFDISGLSYYPDDKIIKVARYERIQFSASINCKKPALSSKRFKLLFELVAFTNKNSPDSFVVLAFRETPPLIIRGRSPSNYGAGTLLRMFRDGLKQTPHMSVFPQHQIQDILDNDYDTFEILKEANNLMEQQSLTADPVRKKHGKKPKPKKSKSLDNGDSERSTKRARTSKNNILLLKGKKQEPKTQKTKDNGIQQRNILTEISLQPHRSRVAEEKPDWNAIGTFSTFPNFLENFKDARLNFHTETGHLDVSSSDSLGLIDLFDDRFDIENMPESLSERYKGGGFQLIREGRNDELSFDNELELIRTFNFEPKAWAGPGHPLLGDLDEFHSKPSEGMDNLDGFPTSSEFS